MSLVMLHGTKFWRDGPARAAAASEVDSPAGYQLTDSLAKRPTGSLREDGTGAPRLSGVPIVTNHTNP